MDIAGDLRVLDSRLEPAAACIVCGEQIDAGDGLTAAYANRIVRFKCAGCLGRFAREPEVFLARHAVGCCRTSAADCSPASEWTCY